jgi:hypothetical protein
MAGHPARNLSVRCAVSQSGRATCENLRRGSPTASTSATPVTASFASQRSKSMQGRHDIHRRFEVPAANGSRPIAGGRLCGGKVSELFRTGEWIRRRSNCRREMFDRLLLFGWLLSQRDPIELSCEGVTGSIFVTVFVTLGVFVTGFSVTVLVRHRNGISRTAGPVTGERWPSRLVAKASEKRLSFPAQHAHVFCGSHCDRRHNWRRTSRLENQTTKRRAAVVGGSKCETGRCQSPKKMVG